MSSIVPNSTDHGTQHLDEPLKVDDESCQFQETRICELVEDVRRRLSQCKLPISPRLDDEFIEKFVRVRKYDAEKAVEAIKKYYGHIYRNLKQTEGMRPSDFIPAYESGHMKILRNTYRGSLVSYVDAQKWDPSKCSQMDLVDSCTLISEELVLNKTLQPFGGITILNIGGVTFNQMKQNRLSVIKHSIQVALYGLPGRSAAIHVLNPPRIYWPIHKFAMKLLPQKIRETFYVHSSLESLHKFLDKRILPESLGGDLKEEDAIDSEFISKLIAKNKRYEEYWSPGPISHPGRM